MWCNPLFYKALFSGYNINGRKPDGLSNLVISCKAKNIIFKDNANIKQDTSI